MAARKVVAVAALRRRRPGRGRDHRVGRVWDGAGVGRDVAVGCDSPDRVVLGEPERAVRALVIATGKPGNSAVHMRTTRSGVIRQIELPWFPKLVNHTASSGPAVIPPAGAIVSSWVPRMAPLVVIRQMPEKESETQSAPSGPGVISSGLSRAALV